MSKKISLKSIMFAVLIIALCIFLISNRKFDILDMNSNDIKSIYIENLDTGQSVEIIDVNTINTIVSNLDSIKVKRYNPSEDYEKDNIKITMLTKDGSDIKGAFNSFVIESSQRIYANRDYYYTVEGKFDTEQLKILLK